MAGDMPWPEVPIGNKNHANAAVVIIGAGISGLCTAIDLIQQNKCKNFIILEKSGGVGGTWHDNKYPGACCDVWSQLYSYSFAQKPDWSREYPGQEEILDYLMTVAQKYNLYQYVRFNTTVEKATWDDDSKKWTVHVSTAKGSKDAEFNPEYDITTDFLVSAVGQLNMPQWPDTIPGFQDFKGKLMHSARWDWSYDLTGKRIAVIGNGATAVQIIPEIAKVASKVTVFQRTPNWVVPRLDAPIPSITQTLFKYVPPIMWRKRALMMDYRESLHVTFADTTSSAAEETRTACKDMLKAAFPDDAAMREKLTPNYNPGCKRIIISDDYYPALAKPSVHLETSPISKLTPTGIEAENGVSEDYDMIVCATGFKTVDFMHPIKMQGHKGRPLDEIWTGGAKALHGVTVSDMPNFGMLYGPNTNLGHNSIILMIEAQSRYMNALIAPVLAARSRGDNLSIRPKHQRFETYNRNLQQELKSSAFADPNCQSWYKTKDGVITNNWSGNVIEYQKELAQVDWEEYEIEGSGTGVLRGKKESRIGRVHEETMISNGVIAGLGVVSMGIVAVGWLARGSRYMPSLKVR